MSIFGESYSKMKSGETEVDLQYSIIRPTWTIPNIIKHQSILTKKKRFIKVSGDSASFQVVCNIWKNGDAAAVMTDLLSYNHGTVKFMPHEDDGNYIYETDGATEADFYIISMIPYYVKNQPPMLEDRLQITFISLKAITLPTLTPGFLVDGDGDYFVDGSGNKLIIKTGAERK